MNRTLPQRAAIFLCVFIACTALYAMARGSWAERLLIDTLTVQPAAQLLQLFAPGAGAIAKGSRLTSPSGGINVLNGCEGADVFILVVAALLAAPLSWRNRLLGFAIGIPLVFAANQLRVITLFFATRSFPEYFAVLHGFIAPLFLILVVGAWFWYFTRRYGMAASVPMYRL